MKKAILLASALVISSTAFAGVNSKSSETTVKTDAFATQEQAYNAGYDLMDEYKAMPSHQLRAKLPINENSVKTSSVEVTDGKVTVEEFSPARGEIQYRAVVEVDYQYKYRES
ncbi:DUF3316 domain-containing protein [Vibrio paucivorans]|uniref:DUF3316 domain-containing protein n=1 Tax=Vibrio paucivorans TaxID=2829489 RepID=A0A9X3CCQ3_9VIBR|nr:DUF3316 domain-containing protein [Vibrio paucivorans]MCW8333303.1 DUF3316 domain-containing protein [Vibrio paucivorans]